MAEEAKTEREKRRERKASSDRCKIVNWRQGKQRILATNFHPKSTPNVGQTVL
jgi:hypothetical protein